MLEEHAQETEACRYDRHHTRLQLAIFAHSPAPLTSSAATHPSGAALRYRLLPLPLPLVGGDGSTSGGSKGGSGGHASGGQCGARAGSGGDGGERDGREHSGGLLLYRGPALPALLPQGIDPRQAARAAKDGRGALGGGIECGTDGRLAARPDLAAAAAASHNGSCG